MQDHMKLFFFFAYFTSITQFVSTEKNLGVDATRACANSATSEIRHVNLERIVGYARPPLLLAQDDGVSTS